GRAVCGAGGGGPRAWLRCVRGGPARGAGDDARGGEGEREALPPREPAARLEDRREPLARGARIGRRLQHDELALLEPWRDVEGCAEHDREDRLALCRERRLERDQDRLR